MARDERAATLEADRPGLISDGPADGPPPDATIPPGQLPDPPEEVEGLPRWHPRRVTGTAPLFPLAILFALNLVDEFDREALQVLLPEIRDHFGLGLTGVLTLSAVILPINLLLELPIAYFADRRNRVRLAVGGAILWACFSALTGVATLTGSLLILYLARGGSALAKNFNATHRSLLSDYYGINQRARVFYAYSFASTLGQGVAPLAAAGVFILFGLHAPFFLLALPTLVVVTLAFRLREPKRGVHERLEAGADAETAATEEEPPGFFETFRFLFQTPTARRIYFSLPFVAASFIGISGVLNLFYEDVYGLGAGARGIIAFAGEVFQVAGLLLGAVLVQRIIKIDPGRVMRLLGATGVFSAACLVVIALSPHYLVAVAAHLLFGMTLSLLLPGVFAVISFAIPPRMRTLGFATGNVWILLGAPALPLVGQIGDTYVLRVGLLVFIPLYLIGSFMFASTGKVVNADIERGNASTRARAEMIRRRNDPGAPILIIRDVDVSYGQTQVLFGVSLEVKRGEILALLGTNGAGKSTLLKAISGLVPAQAGTIVFDGHEISLDDPSKTAKRGVAQVPGGRGIFPSLTVGENLRIAGWMYRKDPAYLKDATDRVLEYFPILRDRWNTPAGNLSGGEQQMLSLSQAFLARPEILMIDELSLGLAPTIVDRLLDIVHAIHENGTTIILVEQSVNVALRIAKRAVFMEKGEVRFSGPTADLLERSDILRAVFLKGAESGRQLAAGAAGEDAPVSDEADEDRRAEILDRPVILEVSGLTKRYGGVTAVNDVALELHEGQILGLIGPNGAGKTTIFDMISGFTTPDAGRVVFNGTDVTDWAVWQRAEAGLARSFQDARLWPSLTVREAIAVSMRSRALVTNPLLPLFGFPLAAESEAVLDERVEEVIALLGLGAFRDKFISELSTGSRRMVEIATLLSNDPKVIVLDEPSSGIAQRETEALGPMLKEVQRYLDCSILIIEHDMPLISGLADHIAALEQGGVIAFGSPADVLNDGRVIESYLGNTSYAELQQSTGASEDEAASGNGEARRRGSSRRRRTSG